MKDPIYMSLLAFTLIFGIWTALVFPETSILIFIAYALSAPAIAGINEYQRCFEHITGISGEKRPRYEYAILGVIPAILAQSLSWTTIATGAILAVVVAVSEETFRAGSFILLKKNMQFPPEISLLIANGAWIAYHFAERSFNISYAGWLIICAFIFSIALVKGGLGAACLAHILTNSMGQWISLTAYGEQAPPISALALAILIIFMIAVAGGSMKWGKIRG